MMIGFPLVILILSAIALLGLVVFLKDPKNTTNRLFVAMSFWIIAWIGSNFLENETSNLELASLFLRIDFASAAILVYFWFLFSLNFPQPVKGISTIKRIVILIPAVAFFILSFSDLVIRNIRFASDGIVFDGNIFYPLYIIYVVSYMVVGGSGGLIIKYRKVRGLERTQILYVLLGLSMSALPAVVLNLFFQGILPVEIVRAGLYGAIFVIGFTAYAITKHHLFDIKVIATELFTLAIWILLLVRALLSETISDTVINICLLVAVVIFGILLIRSVMGEVRQREKMEQMTIELERAYSIEKEAKVKIQELSEAKTQFIMATQHHLRTPLTSMRGYVDLILTGSYGKVPVKIKEAISKLQISTVRLLRIVNELLDVSQFQLGKKVVSLQPGIEMEPILKEVVDELRFTAESKGLYLKLQEPEGKIPTIQADVEKLKVALFNLIDNGIKYTSKGGITVNVEVSDSKVRITSKDTGIGISKERLGTLFDNAFERGKEAKKVFSAGRGIGLYVSNQIIKAHNGKVWAESEGEGKGTAFCIELPID